METVGTVLIWCGLILAGILGTLVALGIIPLDMYMETLQDKRAREMRLRKRSPRAADSAGHPTNGLSKPR
jgi:hypothetical protein